MSSSTQVVSPIKNPFESTAYVTQKEWPFEAIVREVVASLARGEYSSLERQTSGVRLSAEELAGAVAAYGRRLVFPPTDAFTLDVVPIRDADPPAWSVDVALWTDEEGLSDLTLQLTVRAQADGAYSIEIDDLHVL